jgi:hypothetical protein
MSGRAEIRESVWEKIRELVLTRSFSLPVEANLIGSPYELYSCDTCGQKGVHIGEYGFPLPFEFYLKS